MKKQNIIIIAAVAVIGIAALIIALNGSKKSTFIQDYQIEDIEAVNKLYLADKQGNEVLLERRADSTWAVDGQYTASQPLVDMLLETLHSMRIRQQVNKNAIPNVIKDISSRGIKVEVYAYAPRINWFGGKLQLFPHEKLITTYYVGRETQDMLGSFMFREGDDAPYIIHIPGFRGFLTPRFVTDPLKWRTHLITALPVQAIGRVELDIPSMPAESFAVVRDGEGFALELTQAQHRVDGFDTARVARMLSSFAYLNFDEFAAIVPNSSDTSFNSAPRTVLRICDTAGHCRELKTYIKYTNPDDLAAIGDPELYETFDPNRLYAIIDNTDTVLIQYYVFDNILQPASYFLGHDKTVIAR